MTKIFCDICKKEITSLNALQCRIIGRAKNRIRIEIMTGYNSAWNTGDACEACFREAIEEVLNQNFNKISGS